MSCLSISSAQVATLLALNAISLLGCRGSDETAAKPNETAMKPVVVRIDLSGDNVKAGFQLPGSQRQYASAADKKRNSIITRGEMSEDNAYLLLTAYTEEHELVNVKLAISGDTATVESVVPLLPLVLGGHIVEVRSINGSEGLSHSAEDSLPPGAWLIQLERQQKEGNDPEAKSSNSGAQLEEP